MKEKLCKFCGQPFTPSSNTQLYCKRPHYMKCPVCGNQYMVTNNENLKRPPVACSYKCRKIKASQTNLERYGTESPFGNEGVKAKRKQTMINKYGAEYSLQCPELKLKVQQTVLATYGVDNVMKSADIRKKAEETNLQKYGSTTFLTSEQGKIMYEQEMIRKYGVKFPIQSDSIKNKIKETTQQRYGADFFTGSEEGRRRIKQVYQDKYGVDSPAQIESAKQKMKQTFLKHYGVDNPSKNENIKNKIREVIRNKYGVDGVMDVPEIREKIMATSMERYGVPFYIMLDDPRKSSGAISKLNQQFMKLLNDYGIDAKYEHRVNRISYDFNIPTLNIVVDLNPTYTHNMIGNHWTNEGKSHNYHLNRCKLANENGLTIRCVFDWDSQQSLLSELTGLMNAKTVSNTQTYLLHRKAGLDFLAKYGRARIKQYSRKIHIFGAVSEGQIVAAVAIGAAAQGSTPYRIFNYGVKYGCKLVEGYSSILATVNQLIPLNEISIQIDCDRFSLEDIQDLNLDWTSSCYVNPVLYWSKKNVRIPARAKEDTSKWVDEGWLPIEDCGQVWCRLNSVT